MTLPVTPDDDGIRPAGPPDACFYCLQPVGGLHAAGCVTLQRRVRVRYVIEMEIDVPYCWDAAMIEFHRNDSSWCANNVREDLDEHVERLRSQGRCLCDDFRCEVLDVPDAPPFRGA